MVPQAIHSAKEAAYTERRDKPTDGFIGGQTLPYPTGDSPKGANCLEDCGPTSAINYSALLDLGLGHANVGSSKVGVNGLYDMGANVWEWVENGAPREKGTRGGSWWYGASQMEKTYVATKPRDMYAVYIGFRCVREST
jgi:sulfatase modifying factor 1